MFTSTNIIVYLTLNIYLFNFTFSTTTTTTTTDEEYVKLKKESKENKHPKIIEYGNTAHLRPTKCQVCRVFSQELWIAVNNTNNIKQSLWLTNRLDGDEEKRKELKINYKTSELRLMEILENLCKKVYDYRSIAGPDFPYLKGVKSMFRQQLEEAMGTSGLKLTLDAPEEIIEDPTLELRRMHFQCNQLVEEHEDAILEWYLHKQTADPKQFLCAERILESKEDHDCLSASTEIPDFAKSPSKKSEKEKLAQFTNGRKLEL